MLKKGSYFEIPRPARNGSNFGIISDVIGNTAYGYRIRKDGKGTVGQLMEFSADLRAVSTGKRQTAMNHAPVHAPSRYTRAD